jgi:hypothetical protein
MKLDTIYGVETFFVVKAPRCKYYRRTAALRLIVQPCDEDD